VAGCRSHSPAPAAPDDRAVAIIDTHTHFYDPARPQGVPWPPKEDRLLYRTVLPRDYRALPGAEQVTGTVVVEASVWEEDNAWILDLAARNPFILGFVGNLPLGTPAGADQLARFARHPRFRGVRARRDDLPRVVAQVEFQADLRRLADQGLTLDLLIGPDQLPLAVTLAQAVPALTIVIDHVANVPINSRPPPADWITGMTQAASLANVQCKVSGLVEGTGRTNGDAPRDVDFYRPVLDVIWEQFGADRLVYGSNWPVSERFAPLATVQGIALDYFATKGEPALVKVMAGNARRVYGIPAPR